VLTVLLASGVVSAYGVELLQNGGFEDGLENWDASCNVVVVQNWIGITPVEGSLMAVMTPLGVLDSQLAQDFDPLDYESITVSFSYNIAAFDFTRWFDCGTDKFTVSLGGTELTSVPLDDLFDCRGRHATTGWTEYKDTFTVDSPMGGVLSIAFEVENFPPGGGDAGQLMAAFVDGVSVMGDDARGREQVPDSTSTILILACSLLAIEGARRRWAKK